MKKTLLTLSLIATLGMSANIHHSIGLKAQMNRDIIPAERTEIQSSTKALSRAETDGAVLDFAGELYSWLRFSTAINTTYKAFIYITPELATQLAGNKIEAIEFSAVLQSGSPKDGTIFVSEDIDADPVTSTSISVKTDSPQSPNPQIAAFDQPYTIKAGQGFYYGYTISKCRNNDYPVAVGDAPVNMFAGYVQVFKSNGSPISDPNPMLYEGYNLYCKAYTSGDVKGLSDLVVGLGADANDMTLPSISPADDLDINIGIQNIGDNDITAVEYSISINGSQPVPAKAEVNIASKEEGLISAKVPTLSIGRNNIDVTITKINSTASNISYSVPVLVSEDQYKRMFVVEEGTGTWCGYCPYGIMGMEYMAKNYPDGFIGIAVHAGDELEVESYQPIAYNFSGYPGSIWNRDPMWEMYPDVEYFEYFYPNYWEGQKAAAKIEVSASVDGDNIVCDAVTTFGFSEANANYAIAFVITEDGLTAIQNNYLSGEDGAPEPWFSYGESCEWTYTDTARDIFDCFGIEGSVPANITKGVANKFSYSCPTTNVTDIKNTAVTALLIDGETGVIINADRVYADNYSGVENIVANAKNAKVSVNNGSISVDGDFNSARIYSVGGSLINNGSAKVAKGMYIVVVDGVSHKVIVK